MKKILLIDFDDSLRDTRVIMLKNAGYEIDLRLDYVAAEKLDHEGSYDLVLIGVRWPLPDETIRYSDRLANFHPDLPILLLMNEGVFIPRGTLSRHLQPGNPREFLSTVASMLADSGHVRETSDT